MYFNSNEPLIDVACQRLGSNPYSECPLYGWRAAYITKEEFGQELARIRLRKKRVREQHRETDRTVNSEELYGN
jgi:succinate dehydrogenase/fumarate reductase flavoprotein subunit